MSLSLTLIPLVFAVFAVAEIGSGIVEKGTEIAEELAEKSQAVSRAQEASNQQSGTISRSAYEDVSSKVDTAIKQKTTLVIKTKFSDKDLLVKTLAEHGMQTKALNNNLIRAVCPDCALIFERESEEEGFVLKLSSEEELNRLKAELQELNEEYGLNVQAYTYAKIKENLTENMSIESEEVLDDDSILLTINLD